jgi:hypothetical protein
MRLYRNHHIIALIHCYVVFSSNCWFLLPLVSSLKLSVQKRPIDYQRAPQLVPSDASLHDGVRSASLLVRTSSSRAWRDISEGSTMWSLPRGVAGPESQAFGFSGLSPLPPSLISPGEVRPSASSPPWPAPASGGSVSGVVSRIGSRLAGRADPLGGSLGYLILVTESQLGDLLQLNLYKSRRWTSN